MAYDLGLAERLHDLLDERVDVTSKKMFGGLAFMLRGHMFVGVTNDDLMVRVGAKQHAYALSLPHARLMDFTGRPMKGYVFVGPGGVESDQDLAHWVNLGVEFARTLPPK